MNLGEGSRRLSKMFSAFSAGGMSAARNVANAVLKDAGSVDEDIWALYGDPDELDRKCLNAKIGVKKPRRTSAGGIFQETEDEAGHRANDGTSKTPESVLARLPAQFCSADFDPVVGLVREISTWKAEDANENFMHRIEQCDTDKDVVVERLSRLVEANYPALMTCMADVETISEDMAVALQDIACSRTFLQAGQKSFASGQLHISGLQQRRENLSRVMEAARALQVIKQVQEGISANSITGEVGKAAECALHVLNSIRSPEFCQLQALMDMETLVQRQVYVIRQKTDKALLRLSCRKFAPVDYASIVKAYVLLDVLSERFSLQLRDVSEHVRANTPDILVDSYGCVEGLSHRVHRFQTEDVDTCLRTAVLEFLYAGVQKQVGRKVPGVRHGTAHSANMLELEDLSLAELYQKLRAHSELAVPCIVRSCELLADIVHTHYLITQWHLEPFSESSGDVTHLHRCSVRLDDEAEEGLAESGTGTGSAGAGAVLAADHQEQKDESKALGGQATEATEEAVTQSFSFTGIKPLPIAVKAKIVDSFVDGFDTPLHSPTATAMPRSGNDTVQSADGFLEIDGDGSDDATIRRNLGARLAMSYQSFAVARAALWSAVVDGLLTALGSVVVSSATLLDDFLALSWAVRAMIKLGAEFCGAHSSRLEQCLQEKAREYYKHVHGESVYRLQGALEAEAWGSVSVSIDDGPAPGGGVAKILGEYCASASNTQLQVRELVGMQCGLHVLAAPGPAGSGVGALSSRPVADSGSEASILVFFGEHGNPFRFQADVSLSSDDEGVESDGVESEELGEQVQDHPTPGGGTDVRALSTEQVLPQVEPDTSSSVPPQAVGGAAGMIAMLFRESSERDAATATDKRRPKPRRGAIPMVATCAALYGLARGAGEYVRMMYLLPSSAPDIFQGLCQLFDFYLCSVYYGFARGSGDRDDFLAAPDKMRTPAPDQERDFEALRKYLQRALSEVVSIRARGGNIEQAEDEGGNGDGTKWETAPVSASIRVSGVEGADLSTFYGLNWRIVAAESCRFVATLLHDMRGVLSQLLPGAYVAACDERLDTFQLAASQLRSLVYRSACPSLLNTTNVLSQIAEGAWDTRKLRAVDPWVAQLVSQSSDIWAHLGRTGASEAAFAEAAPAVRETAWMELCQCAFDVVVDGFSRVKRASNEGRATMVRNAEAVEAGLEAIHQCRCLHGLPHVQAYLQAGTLAPEEMMLWIQDNHNSYAYRHMHALAVQTFSHILSPFQTSRLKDAVEFIDGLYQVDKDAGGKGQGQGQERKISQLFGEPQPKEKMSLASMLKSTVNLRF